MDALLGGIRGSGSSYSPGVSRRTEEVLLAVSAGGARPEPTLQRRSVEPVFRRPALEPAAQRPAAEPTIGLPAQGGEGAAVGEQATASASPKAPAAPAFEWLHLEVVPLDAPPNPRGYAVYSRQQQPEPLPVILIDTAA